MTVYTSTQRTTDHSTRSGVRPSLVVLHHAAMTGSVQALINLMMPGGRTVSAHAAIKDTAIVSVVPEDRRSWSLGAAVFEQRVLSVECVNSTAAPSWLLSDLTHESIARWVADVCTRHGISPHRTGPPASWTVISHGEVQTIHRQSYATACPGGMRVDWIVARAQQIMRPAPPATATTPAPPKLEEETMAQGAFYRNQDTGWVYWQREPNTPLMHVDSPTWAAYSTQGNKFTNLEGRVIEGLLTKWGNVTRPEQPTAAAGATAGATAAQVAEELAQRLRE